MKRCRHQRDTGSRISCPCSPMVRDNAHLAKMVLAMLMVASLPARLDSFSLAPLLPKKTRIVSCSIPATRASDAPSQPSSRASYNETYDFWEEELSPSSFRMDLQNLAMEDPQRAQDALEIMRDLYKKDPHSPATVEPDTACYTTIIDAYAQAANPQAAQDVLFDMEQIMDATGGCNRTAPSDLTYMLVAEAWADNAKNDFTGRSAEQAEKLMRRMHARGLEPSVKVWSVVMEGWCKRTGIARIAMQRAEKLLTEMEQGIGDAPKPSIVTYTSYIGGLARSKDRQLARKADATLLRMEQHCVIPDVVAYTSVLNCWAKAVSRREKQLAASRALRILKEMERKYSRGVDQAKPSLITYATAIRAIGNSLDGSSPKLAEDVLRRMYKIYESKAITNTKPVTSTYNAVLDALSRAPTSKRVRYARRAEEILAEMKRRSKDGERDVEPDVRTWSAVLRAWSMSGESDAAENAQRVLDKLEELYASGQSSVRPNYVCYTTCMGAWGRCYRRDALDKMEAILKKMEQGYEETLDANIRPNTVSYVTAIDSFVRRNDINAAQRAQTTVDRMLRLYAKGLGHVRPTRIVLNTLIHAWSKSRDPNGARSAEKIFKWMEAQSRSGDDLVRPDEVSLCAVLNAWANKAEDGGSERAEQIWNHMRSLSPEQRGFHLSIMMPNIVIKAIARSRDPRAVEKAEQILVSLEQDFIFGKSTLRPDVTTYSSVINCCAYYRHPEGRDRALEVAMRTFQKLNDSEDDSANNITFGTLFKAIANLMAMGPERETLVQTLFDQCCEEGHVDAFVLSQVRNASPNLYRDVVHEPCGLSGDSIEEILKNLPREWSENVVE